MLERVQKIVENNKDFLKVEENPSIQTLCELDPTPNKKYISWILSQFKTHRIKEEDYYKFNELLGKFHSGKHKLPVENRNINKVNSINSLFSIVNQIPTSKNEGNKLDKEKAYQESVIHYNQDGFMVIEPLTEFSSCFWGKGTNWCTASTTSENYFNYYTKEGWYLLIIITPKGDKYQICSNEDFCDSSDNKIRNLNKILKEIPLRVICKVEKLFDAFIIWKPIFIKYIEEEELYLRAVKVFGGSLEFIKNQTHEICLEAVKQDSWALQYVKKQNPEICLAAVKQDGWTLQYVENQTPEICLAAVKQDGMALRFVKEQTYEICLEAVKTNGRALQYVERQTHEICSEAVKQCGLALRFVKDYIRTNSKVGKKFKKLRKIKGLK